MSIAVGSRVQRDGKGIVMQVEALSPAGDQATCTWREPTGKARRGTFPVGELRKVQRFAIGLGPGRG